MYIEPNTKVNILRNVPLDNVYNNTLWFDSEQAQYAYFVQQHKYMLEEYSYQRVQRNVIRVGIPADNLYDCNYVMFQNKAFGNKWFYAFITGVEYKNNGMSEVTFEIDVMQTWFFDYRLRECYVEREHSLFDDIGDNLVPENFELGDYVTDGFGFTGYFANTLTRFIVASTVDADGNAVTGNTYCNIYNGAHLYSFVSAEQANTFIATVNGYGKGDAIVAVMQMPTSFVVEEGEAAKSYDYYVNKNTTSIGDYVPKNKKLFTYPYNFLYVTNLEGLSANYHYEYFDDERCNFSIQCDMALAPTAVFVPKNYKGTLSNWDERLSLSGFPMCSWTSDAYANWLAINSSNLITRTVTSVAGNVISGVASVAAGNIAGVAQAGLNVFGNITSALQEKHVAETQPPQSHGGGGANSMFALNHKDFYWTCKHIRPEIAEIIDNYFTVYGYACRRVKVPNISSRPEWNFVKTVGCNAIGSVPADDMAKIKSIYDAGITFWKHGENVGNYSLANAAAYVN